MRTRDYLCLFRSKFDVMLKLSDIGLREINQAFFDFLEEREPTFTDAQAQALWWAWSLEFNAQEKEACRQSEIQSERGRLGAYAKKNKHKQKNLAQAEIFSTSKNILLNKAQAKQAEIFSHTETETDTETDTDTVESNNSSHADDSASDFEPPAPTLEQIIDAGKMPDVNLPEAECRKCFDYYEARDWRDSKGRRLKWLPLIRKWSATQGEFISKGNTNTSKWDKSEIRRNISANRKLFLALFDAKECSATRQYGDYYDDPKTFDEWSFAEDVISEIAEMRFSKSREVYSKFVA